MTASDSKRDARGLAQGVLSYARKNVRTIAVLLAALVFVWLLEEVSEGDYDPGRAGVPVLCGHAAL